MRRTLCTLLWFTAAAAAQPVVAPTPETAGPAEGQAAGGYRIFQSFETGYRFTTTGGNRDRYRSDVNYGNGLRLLGSQLTVHSANGRGRLFDEIVLTTQGLGNDPYQSAILRIQKNRWYRYDLGWRSSVYFNPALLIADGAHRIDTSRRMQDHDLVLRPQSRLRILAGYSRNTQDGPAYSTLLYPDSRGDIFTSLWDVRRTRNEYRLGTEFDLWKTRIHVLRGWEQFREDTRLPVTAPGEGANTADLVSLQALRTDAPYHGSAPSWRVGLHNEALRWFTLDGRFTHVAGRQNFLLDEFTQGTGRFGAAQNRQVFVAGNARRPVTTGNLTLSLFPTERLTLTNHTAVYSTRMEGDGTYGERIDAGDTLNQVAFQYLGIRTVANLTDANLRLAKWLALYSGYHYSQRQTASSVYEDFEAPAQPVTRVEQTNHLHSGLAGIRLQPGSQWRISLDGELGRADRPFYTTSEKNYHNAAARVQWKKRAWSVLSKWQTSYNLNSNNLFVHSARGRSASIDGSWMPRAGLAFEGGYGYSHLETVTGIAYFASGTAVAGDRSLYRSNLHQLRFGAQISVSPRAEVYLGFHRIEDTARAAGAAGLLSDTGATAAFLAAQAYPLHYQTPLARVSIGLHKKLRWNAGWQYYNYKEKLLGVQNYRAHTGYTSLTWSF